MGNLSGAFGDVGGSVDFPEILEIFFVDSGVFPEMQEKFLQRFEGMSTEILENLLKGSGESIRRF